MKLLEMIVHILFHPQWNRCILMWSVRGLIDNFVTMIIELDVTDKKNIEKTEILLFKLNIQI